MICISIAQESRRMALADMLNASRQCDLIEVRLDRFQKAPDIGEILKHKPRPIIFSCRRKQDGGEWQGTENERLALLRMCIASKTDYVEIELDAADQIPNLPPAKRIIAYTNLEETPRNIAQIYEEATTKNPDVIKLVTRADTPEDAWPLVQILGKPGVPTVVVGLGKPGVMLSVLARKIGAPWVYAALERGMEAYLDQPTVSDFRDVYAYSQIDSRTRFIGVTGFGMREYVTVGAVNAALAKLELNIRCLPIGIGDMSLFQNILDAVHLGGVIVGEVHRKAIMKIATEVEGSAKEAGFADVLVRKSDNRFAYNTLCRAIVSALEDVVRPHSKTEKPLQGRMILIAGTNDLARGLAPVLRRAGGILIIASHNRDAAKQMAKDLGCRQIRFDALHSTSHDILVVCDEEREAFAVKKSGQAAGIHTGYFREGMTLVDPTVDLQMSPLLHDAKVHGCHIVEPRRILREQIALQIKLIAGKAPSSAALEESLAALLADES
jgi:3-dehydroquinate dehydratase/shikimate dehydrogenase